MAGLNDDGQWIILMGFVVSIIIFILALVASQSTLVGKTTSESVLEFSKTDIQDLRAEIMYLKDKQQLHGDPIDDLKDLSMQRKATAVEINKWTDPNRVYIFIHFNDGITIYSEINDEEIG